MLEEIRIITKLVFLINKKMASVSFKNVRPFLGKSLSTINIKKIHNYPENLLGELATLSLFNAGPLFVKLGQIMAMRSDLLPKKLGEKLEKLCYDCPPIPKKEVKRILKAEYKKLPFKKFKYKPLAVGSIGQVHRAILNGESVVVKIRRPNIEQAINEDIELIELLIYPYSFLPLKVRTTISALKLSVNELGTSIKSEIDFLNEGEALVSFRKKLKRHKQIDVPKYYPECSSEKVLVMEELKGVPLAKYHGDSPNQEELKQYGRIVFKEILTQIFHRKQFHADPHGGNFIVLEDGRLGLIDLGLTGEFTKRDRKIMVKALKAFIAKDGDKIIKALLEFGVTPEDFDFESFKKEIIKLVSEAKSKVVAGLKGESKENSLEDFINSLFQVAYQHNVFVPSQTLLLIKTLVTIEGLAKKLDPKLNSAKIAATVVLESKLKNLFPW